MKVSRVFLLHLHTMTAKKEIVETTFGLMMKYGIRSVSMDDIAKAIGISKKTIYQHFANKQELINSVIESQIESDVRDITMIVDKSENALDEIILMARHILAFLREMSPSMVYDLKKYYNKEWHVVDDHFNDFVYSVVKKNIQRGVSEGFYLSDLNADVISRLYVLQCQSVTDQEYFPGKDYIRTELYKVLVKYHLRALINEKGREYLKHIEIE